MLHSSAKRRKGALNTGAVVSGGIGFFVGSFCTMMCYTFLLGGPEQPNVAIEGTAYHLEQRMSGRRYSGSAHAEMAKDLPSDDLGNPNTMIIMVPFTSHINPMVHHSLPIPHRRFCAQMSLLFSHGR